MKIHEFQGKELFRKAGVAVLDGHVAKTPEEAAEVIVSGMKDKNPRILIGKDARAISLISRLFPKRYLGIIERMSGHKMSLRKK